MMNGDKQFLSLDSNAAKAGLKVNRNYEAGGDANYLTVLDSTASFVELDSAREGGVLHNSLLTHLSYNSTRQYIKVVRP